MNKNKLLLIAVPMSLLISGCTMNSGERLDNLEKEVKAIKSDLDFYKITVDLLEDRQKTIEDSYKEITAKQTEASLPAAIDSLSLQDIQTALKNAGFYSGAIDSKIGPDTERAIKKFQEANGLKADGVVGAKTKSALIKYLPKDAD